jgi:polysaccharide chain length determinant protein (PEP-CTERM system associated)
MLPGKTYTPRELFQLLRTHLWLISGSLAIGIFTALIISALLPDMYRSEMLVQVVPQRVPDEYVRSTVTIRTEERLSALSQQVMSRTQLERLIQEFKLYPDERTLMPLEDVVELMRTNIRVEPVRAATRGDSSDAFYLRFTYPDARLVTEVTGRLGSLLIDQNARDRGALAETTNDFLEAQLTEARNRLATQERMLEAFRERHSGRLPSQLEFNMQAIQNAQLQLQSLLEGLARDRDRKLILERLYADALSEPEPIPVVPQMPTTTVEAATLTPRQQLEVARANLQRLSLRLTPEHPDIIRTKRLIEELEHKVKEEPARPSDGSDALGGQPASSPQEQLRRERLRQQRAELESLERQVAFKESEEKRLRGVIADYQGRIEAVPGLESEWIALTRDYETLKTAYQQLLAKTEDSKVAADLERRQIGEQFRILDPARIPVRPISPNRRMINGLGALLGLLLGVGIVAALELRDSSLRTEADVASVLGVPVLALIPIVETPADVARRRRRRVYASATAVFGAGVSGYVFWAMRLWKYVA